jgi:hypothetical protein
VQGGCFHREFYRISAKERIAAVRWGEPSLDDASSRQVDLLHHTAQVHQLRLLVPWQSPAHSPESIVKDILWEKMAIKEDTFNIESMNLVQPLPHGSQIVKL